MYTGFGFRVLALALVATSLFISDGCRRKPQQQVVLYVSADEHLAREVIDRFQKHTGILVKMVGDAEAKKTTGLVERLRSEKPKPQADVLWSSEIVQTIELADDGVLAEHLSDATKDWPREWRDGQRRWFAFAARPRVIVFSPERVPEGERPGTWLDLARSTWRGRIAMADPRFGTTGTHLGVMLSHWDREVMPGYFRAWAEGLAANDVRVLPSGNAGVVEAVASGEADIGLTDADDVWAAQARGLKVDLIYPSHSPLDAEGDTPIGQGTLLIPNTVARVTGGPNPESARALIDFLLSEEVERLLADSVSHNVPVRESLRGSHPEYEVSNPLSVDWKKAAAARSRGIQQFFDAITAVKQDRAAAAEIKAATSRRDESPQPEGEAPRDDDR